MEIFLHKLVLWPLLCGSLPLEAKCLPCSPVSAGFFFICTKKERARQIALLHAQNNKGTYDYSQREMKPDKQLAHLWVGGKKGFLPFFCLLLACFILEHTKRHFKGRFHWRAKCSILACFTPEKLAQNQLENNRLQMHAMVYCPGNGQLQEGSL